MKKCYNIKTWEEIKDVMISLDERMIYRYSHSSSGNIFTSTPTDPILAKLCELTGAKMYGDYLMLSKNNKEDEDDYNNTVSETIWHKNVPTDFINTKLIPFCIFLSRHKNTIYDKNKLIFSFLKHFYCNIYLDNVEYEGRAYYNNFILNKKFRAMQEIVDLSKDLENIFFKKDKNYIIFNYYEFFKKFNKIKINDKTQIFDILGSYSLTELEDFLSDHIKGEKSHRLKPILVAELKKLFIDLKELFTMHSYQHEYLFHEYSKFLRKEENKWEEVKKILNL
jgi:hypothetical protein